VNRIGASRLQHLSQILQVPTPFFSDGAPVLSPAADESPSYVDRFLSRRPERRAGIAGGRRRRRLLCVKDAAGPRDKRLSKCAGTGGRSLSMARYPVRDTQYAAAVIARLFLPCESRRFRRKSRLAQRLLEPEPKSDNFVQALKAEVLQAQWTEHQGLTDADLAPGCTTFGAIL
jgi:hypothetical protein